MKKSLIKNRYRINKAQNTSLSDYAGHFASGLLVMLGVVGRSCFSVPACRSKKNVQKKLEHEH